jgi:phage shock protein C
MQGATKMTSSIPGNGESQTAPPDPPASPAPVRVLRRTTDDRVIGGVCGGLGRYFGIDPIMMRLLFVLFALAGGSAVLAYIVLWIVVPEERPGDNVGELGEPSIHLDMTRGWQALGFILVVAGTALFAEQVIPGIDRIVWPIVIIAAGIGLIVHGGAKR